VEDAQRGSGGLVARDGALTDAAAAGDPFEIAIIDLQLPASGGLALAHAIKRNPQLSRTRVVGVHEFGDGPVSASTEAAGIRR